MTRPLPPGPLPPEWLLDEFDIDPEDPEVHRVLWQKLACKYHPRCKQERGRGRPRKTAFDRIFESTDEEIDLYHRIQELKKEFESSPEEYKKKDGVGAKERALSRVSEESGWSTYKLDKLYYPRKPRKSRRKNAE